MDRRRRRCPTARSSQAKGFDLPQLGRAVIQTFLRHALRDGFFHADMHPGNLFVDDDGKLIAVDFGIMGRLGPKERRVPRRDPATASSPATITAPPRCISKPATCRAHHSVESFAQAIRAIGEPIHNRTAEDISMAKLLMLLFEVTGLFDMRTRPELLLLQKTMVVVEGVARSLDPKLDMWSTAEPVVREWMTRHLGPAGKLEARGARRRRRAPFHRQRARPADPRRPRARSALTGSPATARAVAAKPSPRSTRPKARRKSALRSWRALGHNAALLLWIVFLSLMIALIAMQSMLIL